MIEKSIGGFAAAGAPDVEAQARPILEHDGGCGNHKENDGSEPVSAEQADGRGILTLLAELPREALLDERALADCLQVSDRTLRRMVDRGQMCPGVSLGRRKMWIAGKVLDHIAQAADREAASARRIVSRRSEAMV